MTIYSLSYHSRNRLEDILFETPRGLDDILRVARPRNQSLGITGALMFTEGRFVQLLEGDEAAVKALFTKIETDRRHSDVAILAVETRVARRFDSWAMAFVGQSAAARDYYSEYTQQKDFAWGKLTADALGQLMLRMIRFDERAVAKSAL